MTRSLTATRMVLAAAVVVAGAAAAPVAAGPREVGVPYYTNYDPKAYNEAIAYQSWASVQDELGVMYFANNSGVVVYDGVSWRLLPLPGSSTVRSLAIDAHGRIFVGGLGTFGYLESGSHGQLWYRSLVTHVPEEDRRFADVWKTHAAVDGVYFQTYSHIFKWTGASLTVLRPETSFHLSFLVDGALYVREEGRGIMRLEGETFGLVPDGGRFADERVYAMVDAGDGEILVGTRDRGLFVLDEDGVRAFPTEADRYLVESQLYDGIALGDGSYGLATLRGGVILLDREGRLLQILDRRMGIQDSRVTSVFQDGWGGLWLTLDHNLTRVQVPAALSIFDEVTGLTGTVQSVVRHRGRLLVATTHGVYRLVPPSGGDGRPATLSELEPITGIATHSLQLLPVGDDVLAATNEGVYRIAGGRAFQVSPVRALSLLRSRVDPATVYVGLLDGLATVRRGPSGWVEGDRIDGVDDEIRTLVEEPDGSLWLGGRYRGVLRATPGEGPGGWSIDAAGSDSGLPRGHGRIRVFQAIGEIFLGTNGGLFRFDRSQQSFVPAAGLGPQLADQEAWITFLREGRDGDVWFVAGPDVGLGVARRGDDGTYSLHSDPFRKIAPRGVWDVLPEEDGVVWVATSNGLVRIDTCGTLHQPPEFHCMIRRVVTLDDESAIYRGAGAPAPAGGSSVVTFGSTRLPFSLNALRFEFAAPFPGCEPEILFSTMLRGFDRGWSEWSRDVKRDYTNLPEGRYSFAVRAKVLGGVTSSIAEYVLEIAPPWHRTWWALLGFVLTGMLVMFGFLRAQVHRVRRKERLEAENRRRAFELQRARDIQRHMLPAEVPDIPHLDMAAAQRTATEVGGDYYDFFPQTDGHIFAAIGDATGHGLGAGLMVASTRTALLTIREESLPDVVTRLNRVLRQVNLGTRLNMALTIADLFPVDSGESFAVRASGGGMAPMYVVRADGQVEELVVAGVPLGALPEPEYGLVETVLGPLDVLVLMSDGVPERRHPERGALGYLGVLRCLMELGERYSKDPRGMTADQILSEVFAAGDRWSGVDDFDDDITVVIIRHAP